MDHAIVGKLIMETYAYPHFPPSSSVVHVALFTDVKNAKDLRASIVRASTLEGSSGDAAREAVNFAFIDARLITSRLHLQTAIYQAVLAEVQGLLRTKTVHSEILWALNPSNNISEAIRRYGVSDTSTSLIVVRVASPDVAEVDQKMQAVTDGTIVPLNNLASLTDWSAVKKYHKLNSEPYLKDAGKDIIREREVIDRVVSSSVAMKSVMG